MNFRALALFSVAAFAADEKPVAALGPYVRFAGPDTAMVRWETVKEQLGAVDFGETTTRITLLDRESRRSLWSVKGTFPESLIIAGDAVIVGGIGDVRAYAVTDGRELWRAEVAGRALGLAVAGGRLFVSTDRGQVVVFGK